MHLLSAARLVQLLSRRRTAHISVETKQLLLRLQLLVQQAHYTLLQALLAILDSPLAKAGKLKVIMREQRAMAVVVCIGGGTYSAVSATAHC